MPGFRPLHLHHGRCPQGWVWSRAAARCYKAFSQRRPWSEARSFCEEGGGHLAQPREAETWVQGYLSLSLVGDKDSLLEHEISPE